MVDAAEARKALLDGTLIGDIYGLGGERVTSWGAPVTDGPAPVCPPV